MRVLTSDQSSSNLARQIVLQRMLDDMLTEHDVVPMPVLLDLNSVDRARLRCERADLLNFMCGAASSHTKMPMVRRSGRSTALAMYVAATLCTHPAAKVATFSTSKRLQKLETDLVTKYLERYGAPYELCMDGDVLRLSNGAYHVSTGPQDSKL
jgi:hypothetical protein